ncbi:RING finger protein PFF0165c-like [Leptopilina heterotoma]|uniref:RING finger protein PFF0165c-like n=1 Tax=Leptopilina heterotoma TaxID=63436 RepID=UPI001CA7DDBD|nr:RING finger protein PFF0165c-like [Leptopilina heterotoma]
MSEVNRGEDSRIVNQRLNLALSLTLFEKQLKFFDGYNIPVEEFIEQITFVASRMPITCEALIITIILDKLEGTAKASTIGIQFKILIDLLDHLKENFSPNVLFDNSSPSNYDFSRTNYNAIDHYNTYQPRNQRQKWGQQHRRKNRGYNKFNNQNMDKSFRKNGQNRNMDWQDYGREDFYNYDRNFDEYNVEYGNLQHRFRNEYKRYKDVQDGYSRDDQKDHRYDNYEESYTMSFNEIYSNIYNSMCLQNSLTDQNSFRVESQLNYSVSTPANEPQVVSKSEESINKKTIQKIQKPVEEEEQTAMYMDPIISTFDDDKEDININEKPPNKKKMDIHGDLDRKISLSLEENQTCILDNKMLEKEEENRKETLQMPSSKKRKNIIKLEEDNDVKNYSCYNHETLQRENNAKRSEISHELNETRSDQKGEEKIVEKSKEFLDIKQANNENVAVMDDSNSLIQHMNSDSTMKKLRKGKPPGKIKSKTQEQLSVKNEEEKKEELGNEVSNEDVIISTNTYAEVEEFVVNKILSSRKSLNQEILEMVEYCISLHNGLSEIHQKYFWDTFLLGTNEKNEVICKFEGNELLQNKIPKIVVTKVYSERLGIG